MPALGTMLGFATASIGGRGAFDPLTLPALSEWFDYRTLTDVGDGNPVGAWEGRRGVYTPSATGTARPTYATDDGDGRAAVQFDGVDDKLIFAINDGVLWGPDGNYEAWFVVKSPPSTAINNTLFVSAYGVQTIIFQTQPALPRLNWYSTDLANFGNLCDVQDDAWHVIRFSKSPSGQMLFVDGVNVDFDYSAPGLGSWSTGDEIGCLGGADIGSLWIGSIRHVMCFTTPLDDVIAAKLTSYLTTA